MELFLYTVSSKACRLHGYGSHRYRKNQQLRFMVMELLGESISSFEKRQPGGRFSPADAVRMLLEMLECLKEFHELGFVHRDIKPSNFVRRLKRKTRFDCCLIDFGMAKRHIVNDVVETPAESAEFSGTSRMASLNCHDLKDLSRRDDCWSFLFIAMRFTMNGLPWDGIAARVGTFERSRVECSD